MSKNLGRGGEGVRRGGGGGGEDGNACNQSQIFYRTPFAHERGAIVQFDWLVARQSKSDIKNLTFMHNRHPEYHTTNKIKNMAESVEAFEFSLQETLKDLSQNGKQIDLKPERGAAIKSLVYGQDVLEEEKRTKGKYDTRDKNLSTVLANSSNHSRARRHN